MNYNFNYYEKIENKILTKLFKNTKYLTCRFEHNDLFIEYDNKIIIGEMKYRKMEHTRYKDAWMLETIKYSNLVKKANETGKKTTILYINYFSDNVLIIWNLNNIINEDRPTFKSEFNWHTAKDFKYEGQKVKKGLYHLRNDEADLIKKITI